MAKASLPLLTASMICAVETLLVAPESSAQPSSTAFDLATPKTTGVVEVDCASFTRWFVSPMDTQMDEAGHTAS